MKAMGPREIPLTPAAAAAIHEPKHLSLPTGFRGAFAAPYAVDEALSQEEPLVKFFIRHLTEEGTSAFLMDLLDAIEDSQEANDLRPLQRVIHSYYRTSLFIRDAGFVQAMLTSKDDDTMIDSREKRRELLKLAAL
jgi:hypothetical protein